MLQFGDSMFPIGGFAFSGGLESAIQKRVVTDAATLLAFARTAVEQAARGDGIALVCAHRAARAGDVDEVVRDRQALVYARKLSGETRTMSVRMGKKFTEMGAHVTGAAGAARLARTRRSPARRPAAIRWRSPSISPRKDLRRAMPSSSTSTAWRRRSSAPRCG